MDLPPHPEADDAGDARRSETSWVTRIVLALVVGLVVVVILLHLTGVVGPGAH